MKEKIIQFMAASNCKGLFSWKNIETNIKYNLGLLALNIKKSSSFGPNFPHLSRLTWFVGFISFW